MSDVVRIIAESLDYVCAERLTPNLPWMAQCLATHGELTIFPSVLGKLERISVSTVRRMLESTTPKPQHPPRPAVGASQPVDP